MADTAQARRMAATLVTLARDAGPADPADDIIGHLHRWTDLPGHDDMVLEAQLAHVTDGQDALDVLKLTATAVAIAEATLFGDNR